MEVRKEIMRSGKHVYLDEQGRPAVLDATPEKIEHYYQSGLDMLKSGLPIPVPLEHQPSATPMNAADRAADLVRNNAGDVKHFRKDIFKDKNGQDVHRLIAVLNIRDDKIGKKVEDGSIRWVSPWINSFTDGKGKEWNEVVSHVALTTRPRIHDQQPFENVAMALSIAAPKALPKDGILLSRAGRLLPDGKPVFPIAFSMLTGVSLSADSPHDPASGQFASAGSTGVKKRKKKKKKKTTEEYERELDAELAKKKKEHSDYLGGGSGNPNASAHNEALYKKAALSILMSNEDELDDDEEWDDEDEGDSKDPPVEGETTPAVEDETVAGMDEERGDVSFEELIPHLLELHGIHCPVGGKGKEFLQQLVQGLLKSAKTLSSEMDGNKLDDPNANPQNVPPAKKGPIQQESPPMYMSLTQEKVNAIPDKEKREMAQMLFSLQSQTEALRKNTLDDYAKKRQARIDNLFKLLPVSARDRLARRMATVQLSLAATGVVDDPLADELANLEEIYRGLPELLKSGANLSLKEQPQPKDDGTMTNERADQLANALLPDRKKAG